MSIDIFTKEVDCPKCYGEGFMSVTYLPFSDEFDYEEECTVCNGTGTIII